MKLETAFWTGAGWIEAGEECPPEMIEAARKQGALPKASKGAPATASTPAKT